ncbi:pantetheine-phosphate adenylyltransferase [bacterium]|nr:pantetheine-phosphate adenylyltransferase [bacterium]
MNICAIYPGSFDPITNGHLDLILRGSKLFRRLIVAVAKNSIKRHFFSIVERVEMVKEAVKPYTDVEVVSFDCLLIDCVKKYKANVIIRGLRAVSDFEYELQMALVNRKQDASIETIFMMPDENHIYLSSSVVKELAQFGGAIDDMVPPCVAERLKGLFDKAAG